MRIHEPELLHACIGNISLPAERENLAPHFMAAIDQGQRHAIIAELSSLLCAEQQAGKVECVSVKPSPTSDLAARIWWHTSKTGETTTMFFNITDAATEAALPIVGIFLTLLFGKPLSASVSIASVGKTLWSKIVSLSSSHDAVALEVLRAIGAIRASRFAGFSEARIGGAEFPSTEQICARVQGLSEEQVREGLKRLAALGLIECKFWGDQKGDLNHKEDCWGERL